MLYKKQSRISVSITKLYHQKSNITISLYTIKHFPCFPKSPNFEGLCKRIAFISSKSGDSVCWEKRYQKISLQSKHFIILWFFERQNYRSAFSNSDINKAMEELKTLFKAYLIPIRPQRSIKRNIGKYRAIAKLIDSKNQKDTL